LNCYLMDHLIERLNNLLNYIIVPPGGLVL